MLYEKIPNNVNLHEDRQLQRALEQWQPNFLKWWREVGPDGFQEDEIYLRTAVSVDPEGWAVYDYVKMPEYRWGIFLVPPKPDRRIGFGDHIGQPVWNEVPGELRKELRRIIVVQADTEPASVEQQRLLGHTAPSLYDLRNLFQVNVEEGRHLWAMVYLLHKYFGRDGREEAEDLLVRRSGHRDNPRILNSFNKPVRDWVDFFCFAMFMDRDGKYQLAALAESGFDPLSRTTQFMLTEEAHHLFVGETGIERIVKRTAELMRQDPNEDVIPHGGIPLDILQKYINEWFSAALDLFGSEDSSNAAMYFAAGLKGRFREQELWEDHRALEGSLTMEVPDASTGHMRTIEIPLRRAMNQLLREAFVADCRRALERWNKVLERAGIAARLSLPSQRFNREVGMYAGYRFSPTGQLLSEEEWQRRRDEFLPSEKDREYVRSLMVPVYKPGEFASWIAPPVRGVNGKPLDFEYVRFHRAV